MGPCSCDRKRPPLSSRLGRRLGSVVQLQVSKFWSWKYCWSVCTSKVGQRKTKVRDFSDSFTESPHHFCLLLRFLTRRMGMFVDVSRLDYRYAGWWGHDPATRFLMPPTFSPIRGAQGLQLSNPSALGVASLLGSLRVFKEAGMMGRLRERSVELTAHLERLLVQSAYFIPPHEAAVKLPSYVGSMDSAQYHRPAFTIITPTAANSRGSQLSLLFFSSDTGLMEKVHERLSSYGVISDERRPDVIRLAPIALYNAIQDCENAAKYLEDVLKELDNSGGVRATAPLEGTPNT